MNPAAPVTRIKSGLRPLRCTNRLGHAAERILWPRSCERRRVRLHGLVGRCGAELRHLASQPFDFLGQQVVLVELAAKEGRGDVDLLLDSVRREDVEVACLVVAVLEVAGLDPPLLDQRAEAIVDLAEADAELAGELALRRLGVVGQIAEKPVTDFSTDTCGHGLYRSISAE